MPTEKTLKRNKNMNGGVKITPYNQFGLFPAGCVGTCLLPLHSGEAETGGQQDHGQPGLHSRTLVSKRKNKTLFFLHLSH